MRRYERVVYYLLNVTLAAIAPVSMATRRCDAGRVVSVSKGVTAVAVGSSESRNFVRNDRRRTIVGSRFGPVSQSVVVLERTGSTGRRLWTR